jgi:hypothetical protein
VPTLVTVTPSSSVVSCVTSLPVTNSTQSVFSRKEPVSSAGA